MDYKKVDIKYSAVLFVAFIITFLFHEFGHWFSGTITGHKMVMTLNGTSLVEGKYSTAFLQYLVISGGPLFTIIQILIFYFILQYRYENYYLYPFIFAPILMRVLTVFLSLINPQDEAKLSIFLGLGTLTLPLIVAVFLLYIGYLCNNQLNIKWKFNLINGILGFFYIIIIIVTDDKIKKLFNITLN